MVRIPFFYCSNYDTMIISKTIVQKSIRQTERKNSMDRADKKKESTDFLADLVKKINSKLARTDQSLLAGQKDIERMHDYYWENYTEMDQYGYENYDNQQALLNQTNANAERIRMQNRLQKMLDSPFFGRVDFRYDGESTAETFYIGIANFAEKTGETPLIYDWRAPVSALFYDYDSGPAAYQAPAGILEGEILSKWQYKIRRGKLVYAFESDTKIDDEILKQELGSTSDVTLKNIVRTIQKEQNAIIRNTKDKILVIQGTAGSGKTSVALHRIAYLLYHDRDNLKSSDVLILSPGGVFADYISHILPELGEEPVQEMSFDLFTYRELKDVAPDCEDRYHQLERLMKFPDPEAYERYLNKQSEWMSGQMEGFLATLEDSLMDFHDLSWNGLYKREAELIHLFYFRFQNVPLLARMDAVMEYVADEYETLKGRDLSEEESAYLRQKFDSMYVTKDIYQIYSRFLESCGWQPLPDVPYERRLVEYEDAAPMLYLKYRLLGKGSHKRIKHLVIDEMQDYSYIQYLILAELFSCSMTILGDKYQTLDEEMRDVTAFLPRIFGSHVKKISMNKSYRNTVEIAAYASGLLHPEKKEAAEYLERHGKPVEEETFPTIDEMLDTLCGKLRIQGENSFETAALLSMTEAEAYDLYQLLKNKGLSVSYIDRDTSAFLPGLSVTTFYLAKGLEFDQVFMAFREDGNPFLPQAKYICATRALHELYMFEIP